MFLFCFVEPSERHEGLRVRVIPTRPHTGLDSAAHIAPLEHGFERPLVLWVLALRRVTAADWALVFLFLSLHTSEGEGEVAVSVIPRPEPGVWDAESRRGF